MGNIAFSRVAVTNIGILKTVVQIVLKPLKSAPPNTIEVKFRKKNCVINSVKRPLKDQ